MIKKAFRRLAHEYHPDKNPGNEFSAAQFRELKEAYHILGSQERKAQYDQERWLSGKFKKNSALSITPDYLLKEVQKLNSHLSKVDVYRMNRQLLHEYLLLLLQDNYIGILQLKADRDLIITLIEEIIRASAHLPFYYSGEILRKLQLLLPTHDPGQVIILTALKKKKNADHLQRAFPWIVALVAVLTCIAMYFFAKRN